MGSSTGGIPPKSTGGVASTGGVEATDAPRKTANSGPTDPAASLSAPQRAELNRILSTGDRAAAVRYLASIGHPVAVAATSYDRPGLSFANFVDESLSNRVA